MTHSLPTVADYEQSLGAETVARVQENIEALQGLNIAHFNSTYYGGGVAEAMLKGTPMIGGDLGGMRCQIVDGVNGFLVCSVEQAADRIVQLVRDDELRQSMGQRAHETVCDNLSMTRLLDQYLDFCGAFEAVYQFDRQAFEASRA